MFKCFQSQLAFMHTYFYVVHLGPPGLWRESVCRHGGEVSVKIGEMYDGKDREVKNTPPI